MKLQELKNIISPIQINNRKGHYNVYAIVDKEDTVLYIGKGTKKRLRCSNRSDEYINVLIRENKSSLVTVAESIMRPCAEALETYLIAKLREFEIPLINQWTYSPTYCVNVSTREATICITKQLAADKIDVDAKTIVSTNQAIGEFHVALRYSSPEDLLPLVKAGQYSTATKMPAGIVTHIATHSDGTIIRRCTRSALAKPTQLKVFQVQNAYHRNKTINGWKITSHTS